MTGKKGFTLLEVLVVASIAALITGFLITNFSRSRTDLNQARGAVVDGIREAQSLALSGSLVQGATPCGFGIHFMDDRFLVYAGPSAAMVDCSIQNPDYQQGTDVIVRSVLLPGNALEIVPPFEDIFFEPPDPITYIGGSSASGITTSVSVRKKGELCPGPDCRIIEISSAGRIQLK